MRSEYAVTIQELSHLQRAAVASTSKGELEAVSDDDLDEEPCAEVSLSFS